MASPGASRLIHQGRSICFHTCVNLGSSKQEEAPWSKPRSEQYAAPLRPAPQAASRQLTASRSGHHRSLRGNARSIVSCRSLWRALARPRSSPPSECWRVQQARRGPPPHPPCTAASQAPGYCGASETRSKEHTARSEKERKSKRQGMQRRWVVRKRYWHSLGLTEGRQRA